MNAYEYIYNIPYQMSIEVTSAMLYQKTSARNSIHVYTAYLYGYTHMYVNIFTCTYVHVYICMYVYMYVYIYQYMHMHMLHIFNIPYRVV